MPKLAVIDSDALLYQSSKETLQESIEVLDEKLNNILTVTDCTHYALFVSNGIYFRNNICSNYKQNRTKYPTQLKWLKSLKGYLQDKYKAKGMHLVEADDLVAYLMNNDIVLCDDGVIDMKDYVDSANSLLLEENSLLINYEIFEKVLCSTDKDLLNSISGIHFNYTYKLEDKEDLDSLKKGWFVETSEADAANFENYLLMFGDASDNIKSPFPESAAKWFIKNNMCFEDALSAYIHGFNYETATGMKKFAKGYNNKVEALLNFTKNYKLIHLLNTHEDFIREIGITPTYENILKVETEIENNNEKVLF